MGGDALRYKPKHPLLAGGITGGIEICITFPLEYAKCQLQLAEMSKVERPANHRISEATAGHRRHLSSGLLGVFRDTVRSRGVIGLYSGLSPWLMFSFPRAAFRFAIYEEVLNIYDRLAGERGKQAPTHIAMVAGVVAGVVEATTCMTPMHCIQIKTQQDATCGNPRCVFFHHTISCQTNNHKKNNDVHLDQCSQYISDSVVSCMGSLA